MMKFILGIKGPMLTVFTDDGVARAATVIGAHRKALDAIAKELIEKETIERSEFETILIAHGIIPKKREEEGITIAPSTGSDII